MDKVKFSRCYLIMLLGLLLLSLDFAPVLAATPQNGSYMARFYAPYYEDYIAIYDSFSQQTVNSATDNVTVQGHVYIENADSHSYENEFKVFEFYFFTWIAGLPRTYYSYGATVKVSDTSLDDEYKLYVSAPYPLYYPDETYIRTLSEDTWYNITLVHNETNLEVWVNDVLNTTITDVTDSNVNMNYLRIGEVETDRREEEFAYNLYVDYVRVEGGGLGGALTWDFESDFSDFDSQLTSDGATLEIVSASETGDITPPPEVNFVISPESQSNYTYSTVTFEVDCYNEGTEAQFTLEIVSRYGDDADTWTWRFSDSSFILGEEESTTIYLYCTIGTTGNYSSVLVHFRRVGTSTYAADTATTISLGSDPSTVTPIGPIPTIVGYEYALFGLYGSLGLGGLFWGAMSRGKEPMVGVIGFAFGIVFFTWMEWLPQWIMVTLFAIMAIAYAVKFIGGLGGK